MPFWRESHRDIRWHPVKIRNKTEATPEIAIRKNEGTPEFAAQNTHITHELQGKN